MQRVLTPSIDRIDNSKGYVIGNMQWIPLGDNIKKDRPEHVWKDKRRDSLGRFIT